MRMFFLGCLALVLPVALCGEIIEVRDRVVSLEALSAAEVTVSDRGELRLTGTGDVMRRSTVNLEGADAWLFFENIGVSTVTANLLDLITVNGAAARTATNVRVAQYGRGAVVMPHGPGFVPMTLYSQPRLTGGAVELDLHTFYSDLMFGRMRSNVSSFRLKRGYMATIAENRDGTGVSRVFVAQDADVNVTHLPPELENNIRFARVVPWRWVAKKGWAGDAGGANQVNASWSYNWNANENTGIQREYVPIRQTRWWPDFSTIYDKQNVSHLLGFNEPDNPDEANMSVADVIGQWPQLMRAGLRLGSPAPRDSGLNWLYSFIDQADALGYRVDFVVVHFYRGCQTADQLYNWLRDIHLRTGRPLWVKEWNNGAPWTGCEPATSEQQGQIIESFMDRMDGAPFIERYSIYGWFSGTRAILANNSLTPSGVVYRDHVSPQSFRHDRPFVAAGVYADETAQANGVDAEMAWAASSGIGQIPGASLVIPASDFNARIAAAEAVGRGGVVDFEGGTLFGAETSQAAGFRLEFDEGRKSMTLRNRAGNGGSYSISGARSDRTAVSGDRMLSRNGNPNFELEFGDYLGFAPTERVVAAGVTVLGRDAAAASSTWRFVAFHTNGRTSGSTSTVASINTGNGNGTADTFSAIAAPPGSWLTHIRVQSDQGVFTSIDDIAIITGTPENLVWPAQVFLSNLEVDFDGTPQEAAVETGPADLATTVTYDGSTELPVAAGQYTVRAEIDGPAYSGVAEATFAISIPDGMGDYEVWARTAFGEAFGESGAPDQDPDGDGFDNRSERLAGTAPRDAGEWLRVERAAWDEGGFRLHWIARENVVYRVTRSVDFVIWTVLSDPDIAGLGGEATYVDLNPPAGASFYRVEIVTP